MPTDNLPILSLAADEAGFAHELGASFRQFGFAMVTDHGLDSDLVERAWRLTREFFDLSETEKQSYIMPGQAGARGYTPFWTEIAKGAARHDLKEFWHVGREPPGPEMPANLWPEQMPGFRDTFTRLFAEFDRIGAVLLSRIALDLGLAPDWFDEVVASGNSVLRLLHYPPISSAAGGAVRAGAHEDINLITLLLGADEAGLELLTRGGTWLAVEPPAGALAVNIGDMLQRLTNHVLPSTTHRVRNPSGARAKHSRYAMPFFLHPRSDFEIATLRGCVSENCPDRYPEPIVADDYLQERLREIGLRT